MWGFFLGLEELHRQLVKIRMAVITLKKKRKKQGKHVTKLILIFHPWLLQLIVTKNAHQSIRRATARAKPGGGDITSEH